jgi:hypothetical protein
MFRVVVFLSALLLSGQALAATLSFDERARLATEAGRLGILVQQSRETLAGIMLAKYFDKTHLPVNPKLDMNAALGLDMNITFYDTMSYAVLSYNLISYRACQVGAVDASLCVGPYLPPWFGRPGDYDEVQLRDMMDGVNARLIPFWGALCAKAPAKLEGEPVCPME